MWQTWRPFSLKYSTSMALRALLSHSQGRFAVERQEEWTREGVPVWCALAIVVKEVNAR